MLRCLIFTLCLSLLAGCASSGGDSGSAGADGGSSSNLASGAVSEGQASWYGAQHQGKTTANGEPFDMNALTAAHRKLPFGSKVRVTNLDNGRSVIVRINDRGPYRNGRIIDLSRKAAEQLGMLKTGTAPVKIEVINP